LFCVDNQLERIGCGHPSHAVADFITARRSAWPSSHWRGALVVRLPCTEVIMHGYRRRSRRRALATFSALLRASFPSTSPGHCAKSADE